MIQLKLHYFPSHYSLHDIISHPLAVADEVKLRSWHNRCCHFQYWRTCNRGSPLATSSWYCSSSFLFSSTSSHFPTLPVVRLPLFLIYIGPLLAIKKGPRLVCIFTDRLKAHEGYAFPKRSEYLSLYLKEHVPLEKKSCRVVECPSFGIAFNSRQSQWALNQPHLEESTTARLVATTGTASYFT